MEVLVNTLIILFYYNRPELVKQTLMSIKSSVSTNWRLLFIDDGSDYPGYPIVSSLFSPEEMGKISTITVTDTKADKLHRKGSHIGYYANEAMKHTDCELCIFLNDDDCLVPDYLGNLEKYFTDNPDAMYAYSHVIPIIDNEFYLNPLVSASGFKESWLNKTGAIDPYCQVDASQVCWRSKCIKEGEIRLPYPKTSCLDSDLYGQLCEKYGLCPFTGFYSQFKRLHPNQLGIHSSLDRID